MLILCSVPASDAPHNLSNTLLVAPAAQVRALFSASLSETAEDLARTIMHAPLRVTVGETLADVVDMLLELGCDQWCILVTTARSARAACRRARHCGVLSTAAPAVRGQRGRQAACFAAGEALKSCLDTIICAHAGTHQGPTARSYNGHSAILSMCTHQPVRYVLPPATQSADVVLCAQALAEGLQPPVLVFVSSKDRALELHRCDTRWTSARWFVR